MPNKSVIVKQQIGGEHIICAPTGKSTSFCRCAWRFQRLFAVYAEHGIDDTAL